MTSKESWKSFNGFFGLYEISDKGRVRSLTRVREQVNHCGGITARTYSGRLLKDKMTPSGYCQVSLSDIDRRHTINIHREVARHFLEDFDELLEVNHKDGDKSNNTVSNLEMMTSSENKYHAIKTGLRINNKGVDAANFRGLVYVLDKEGSVIDTLAGTEDILNKGFSACGVSAVLTGRAKTHRGYYFRREYDDRQ